jgi:hypothetical protein
MVQPGGPQPMNVQLPIRQEANNPMVDDRLYMFNFLAGNVLRGEKSKI